MKQLKVIIIGSGPAGLGAAFQLLKASQYYHITLIEKGSVSSGGLRNDCKMNFTYPVGFPPEFWDESAAQTRLSKIRELLKPEILPKRHLITYQQRAARLGVDLIDVEQTHLGTDRSLHLINELINKLRQAGVEVRLQEEVWDIKEDSRELVTSQGKYPYDRVIFAPGRKGFRFLQRMMDSLRIAYLDNIVDIGIRLEMHGENYPIVNDYYDPKFIFPDKVRTFCTNSLRAYVVKEKYALPNGHVYFTVNGHAYSDEKKINNLVNFALLKTVCFTEPLASGQDFAEMLGTQAALMGGGKPIMQRVGDFRLGKRSKQDTFNADLYTFEPTLKSCTPGDISLAIPAKIMRSIWKSMKLLDTISPGILHPSTIMYYPEIKLYANKPQFVDNNFKVKDKIYMIGDGAGTSRGITAAWASGIRAAEGIYSETEK